MRGGKVAPYRRTYAKRLPKAPALLAELEVRYRESLFDEDLLPVLVVPQRPRPAPRKRCKIEPPSLPLAYPPSIADLLADLGPTHEAIAARVGLSRPQTTNIICGRFGVSRPIVRRGAVPIVRSRCGSTLPSRPPQVGHFAGPGIVSPLACAPNTPFILG
ncbi:MAG TPA: hypothetical protein VKA12_10780 [Roseiarcus sp.]|nr:hypothetical protein [Roseiarcus sp.]